MALKVTDESFKEDIINHKGYALVDFWAEWCGPCKELAPIIDELSKELAGKVKVAKMDISSNPQTPSSFGVRGIPTMILFKDGKQLAVKVGSLPKHMLRSWIDSEIA